MTPEYYAKYTIGPGPIQLTPRFKTPEEVIHWIEKDQKLWCVWTVFKVGEEARDIILANTSDADWLSKLSEFQNEGVSDVQD